MCEADARTTMGMVVVPQVITATAGTEVVTLVIDNKDRELPV